MSFGFGIVGSRFPLASWPGLRDWKPWAIALNLLLIGELCLVASVPHVVFAHYMVCFATYGQSLEGYRREIREAQAAGIDGFALNVGAWSGRDAYYKARVKLIYEAALRSNTEFKLFFSADLTNAADIVDMVSTYSTHPNTFKHDGKVVLSTYGQNDIPAKRRAGVDWSKFVLPALKAAGVSVFFVPHFWPDPVAEMPTYADGKELLRKYADAVDGLFLFGGAGRPAQLAQSNADYTRAVHEAGKLFMAGITAHYWGCSQRAAGRRYFEFDAGEGLTFQWETIIATQPDWVEIVTWNDWNESTYIAPVDDPGVYASEVRNPRRYSHAAYLEISKRYIEWYKTGKEPLIERDAVFCSYRVHPRNSIAADPREVPVSWFIGETQDVIYTTALLMGPAELETVSGENLTTRVLPQGLSHIRTSFRPGSQAITLRRAGRAVLSLAGPPIVSEISVYNFFPATCYAYGTNPPSDFPSAH